jgi:hypothetical protein
MLPIKIILISIAIIILIVTINIISPLFINSFQTNINKNPESFFIVLCDIIFTIITVPILYIFFPLKHEKFFVNFHTHKKLAILGFIWSIADLSGTYAGFTNRTPADVQVIIANFFFPLTIMINMILKIDYDSREIISFLIIIIGLLVAILPLYSEVLLNNINIIWVFVYFISIFSGVVSYIYQECKLDINIVTIFFWCNVYELIFTILLFWLNIIPSIGYNSLDEWWSLFTLNYERLISNQETWLLGISTTIINNIKILLKLYIIQKVNSSFLGIITSISNPLSIIIWYFFETIPLDRFIFELFGTIIIIYGFIKYSRNHDETYYFEL